MEDTFPSVWVPDERASARCRSCKRIKRAPRRSTGISRSLASVGTRSICANTSPSAMSLIGYRRRRRARPFILCNPAWVLGAARSVQLEVLGEARREPVQPAEQPPILRRTTAAASTASCCALRPVVEARKRRHRRAAPRIVHSKGLRSIIGYLAPPRPTTRRYLDSGELVGLGLQVLRQSVGLLHVLLQVA